MKKVALVCSGGMSSSLLVTKILQEAKNAGEELEMKAIGEAVARKGLQDYDVVLLAPQISYLQTDFEKQIAKEQAGTKLLCVDMMHYGRMDAKAVYNSIKQT